jgi:hypothetical protein
MQRFRPIRQTATMPNFQYSRFDGSDEFTPQSADKLFDELRKYMLQYG